MNEEHVGKASYIASLLIKHMQGCLEPGERKELDAWLLENGCNFLLYEELADNNKLSRALDELNSFNKEAALQKLSKKLFKLRTGS